MRRKDTRTPVLCAAADLVVFMSVSIALRPWGVASVAFAPGGVTGWKLRAGVRLLPFFVDWCLRRNHQSTKNGVGAGPPMRWMRAK